MDDEKLIACAREAADGSYAPYSGYRVGAALLANDGRVFTGANVENASYGASICAERAALVKAVNDGARSFTVIAVFADSDTVPWPCGICRQMLSEFSPGIRVIAAGAHETCETSLSEIFAHPFG